MSLSPLRLIKPIFPALDDFTKVANNGLSLILTFIVSKIQEISILKLLLESFTVSMVSKNLTTPSFF